MRKIIGMIGAHGNGKETKHYITINRPMELKYDLRLGNQVQQGEIIQLEPEWVVVKGKEYYSKGFTYEDIKPIELNESSIVYGLGFEKAKDKFEGYLSPKPGSPRLQIISDSNGVYLPNIGIVSELLYVHELQNLYQEIFKKRLIWL